LCFCHTFCDSVGLLGFGTAGTDSHYLQTKAENEVPKEGRFLEKKCHESNKLTLTYVEYMLHSNVKDIDKLQCD